MNRVSVIIPCYNYGRFLHSCLNSVLSQRGVEVHVLVIDDASTDDSASICGEIAARDERVELLRHATNKGHIDTYNEGISWASEKYTLLLSADDLLTPGSLFRATQVMENHPEVGFTYGPVMHTDMPEEERFQAKEGYRWWIFPGQEYIRTLCSTGENVAATPTAVVRTSVQKQLGGYRKELPHAGDMEMWLRFAAVSPVGYVDEVQAYYRIHGGNMSARYEGLRDFQQRVEVFNIFFDHYGYLIAESTCLKNRVFHILSHEALDVASDAFDTRDLERCLELSDYAATLDPTVRRCSRWKRLQYKQLMGVRLWTAIRPLARRVKQLMKDRATQRRTLEAVGLDSRPSAEPLTALSNSHFSCVGAVGPGLIVKRG